MLSVQPLDVIAVDTLQPVNDTLKDSPRLAGELVGEMRTKRTGGHKFKF